MNFSEAKPKLIDFSSKNFINNNLKLCHTNRVNYYSKIFNGIILLTIVSITFVILYQLSFYKKSKYDMQEKMLKDQEYVLSKIKYYKENSNKNSSLITNLPTVPLHNLPHL